MSGNVRNREEGCARSPHCAKSGSAANRRAASAGKREVTTWGVITQRAAVGLAAEPQVLALVRARFPMALSLSVEGPRGSAGGCEGVRRGPVGPPGPLDPGVV
jgi:hypothetical protein